MKFKSDIEVQAGIKDSAGSSGNAGSVLSSTSTGVTWIDNYSDWTSVVKHVVKNNGVAVIPKGSPVYVTGSDGTNMLVGLAGNGSEATSSKTMGIMQTQLGTSGSTQTGYVITEGLLQGLNTAGRTAGDPIWLGPNGTLIYGLANKPYAPAHLVFIGIVTKISAGNGEIFVNVQNGFELNEIHDVDIKTNVPINGDVLGYNGTLWVNKTIAGWLGYTPANDANVVHLTGSETITGAKYFTGTISSTISSSTDAIFVDNTGGRGVRISNNSNGFGLIINNGVSSTATPFAIQKGGSTVLSANDAGEITANKFIKLYGTAAQILAADGSVITAGTGISISGGTISSTVVGGVTSFNTRTGAVTLMSNDVTTALGYTPADDANVVKLTGDQAINGFKRFLNTITLNNSISNGFNFEIGNTGFFTSLKAKTSGGSNIVILPSAPGTLALLSDFNGYVPYTGATSNVDLGSYSITANSFIKVGGNSTQYLKADGSVSTAMNSRIEVNFIATSGQTTFVTPYEVGQIDVYYNGSKLYPNEFTATNGTDIILATGATLNAQISVVKYVSSLSTTAIRNETTFTTTAGQTTFAVNYSPGQVDVFYNGSKLNISEFTAVNGTSVVLGFACAAGESVVIDSYVNQISGASGTANYVSKFTGAASLGNSLIYDSGTNIGINTVTPINDSGQTSLTINNVAGSRLDLTINNLKRGLIAAIDTQFLVLSQTAIPLILGSNDTERMRITPSGNIAIGTTLPTAKLDVVDNNTYQLRLASSTGNYSNGGLYLGAINTSDPFYYGFMRWEQSDQTLRIGSQHGNAVGGMLFLTGQFNTSPIERMRITPNGNVLIGTTGNAGYKLDVNGAVKINGNLNYNTGDAIYPRTTTVTDWYLSKHNQTLDRIENALGTNGPFTLGNHVGSTYTANIFFYGNGAATFNQTVTATAFIPSSDIRLKNLTDYDYDVKLIKPITYTWKDSDDKRKKIGYSAQEVREVLPDAVNEDDKGMLSVDYNQIFVAKIDMLENIIRELKAEIEILKNK